MTRQYKGMKRSKNLNKQSVWNLEVSKIYRMITKIRDWYLSLVIFCGFLLFFERCKVICCCRFLWPKLNIFSEKTSGSYIFHKKSILLSNFIHVFENCKKKNHNLFAMYILTYSELQFMNATLKKNSCCISKWSKICQKWQIVQMNVSK